MSIGQRHQSLRRKGELSTESRSKRLVSGVDILVYVVSILSLIFTIDQVRIIWIEHNASGVSLLSWLFYALSAVVWLLYGYIHKDRIIIILNALWVACDFIVVVGVIIYGR